MNYKKIALNIILCICIVSCSTRGAISTYNSDIHLDETATFKNVSVVDESGYIWDDKDKIDIAETMKNAIDAALMKENLAGDDYTIKTTIIKYDPGNAFKRWLLPGDYGATKLDTITKVYKDDTLVANIPVERYVGFGGVFTIGKWKAVFNEVAETIVEYLKKAKNKK